MQERPKILKLPEHVANQIAAGEVVERPAAVVKELVENSIDAGATRVEVAYQNGGKTFLIIEDNGHGMSPSEAKLSLERHATSKLRSVEDLHALMTFGFRGEALPSIASVSEFTLATQTADCAWGTEIHYRNGQFAQEKSLHKPVGTRIEVRHLFNPVPARRKFLKTDATEGAHITHMMRLYALAYPKIAFCLKDKQRTIFEYEAAHHFDERLEAFLGYPPDQEWLNLHHDEEKGLRIWGKISKPHATRTTREEMAFWVNRRPIRSRLLSQALVEGYQSFIPQGRFPMAFLFVEIDPKSVDVNVHPTKQEVRFRDEGLLRMKLIALIRATLENALEKLNEGMHFPSQPHRLQAIIESPQRPVETVAQEPDFKVSLPPTKVVFEALPIPPYEPQKKSAIHSSTKPLEKSTHTPSAQNSPPLAGWRFLSHWEGPYSIFLSPQGLVVLHRSRAAMRIDYEQIRSSFQAHQPIPIQKLIDPIPLPDSLRPILAQPNLLMALEGLGFPIENHALQGFPQSIETMEAVDWLEKTLHSTAEPDATSGIQGQWQHDLAVLLAQKRNKQVAPLPTPELALKFMQKLLHTTHPNTCPQGKKVYWQMKIGEFFT
jgi:DNA mismatch repair protein MutL